MNTEYQDVDKTMYDGLEISGREVAEVIKKSASANFKITVITKKSPTPTPYALVPTALPARSSNDYINPTAQFLGKITYDASNVINGLILTQQ
jgi:hypothetical protein